MPQFEINTGGGGVALTVQHQAGTLAARPAASAVDAGSFYLATDTNVMYRSDGSSTWVTTSPGAAASTLDGLTDTTITTITEDDFLVYDSTSSTWLNESPTDVLVKLNVEAGADVTDVTNVTSAGALMDSELTDIAAVKTLADASIASTDTGTSTTEFVTPASLEGSARSVKLDGIETAATADQSASEVLGAVISGSTYSTVQHFQDVFHSAGITSGGGITDDGDGTITVAAGTGLIRATNSDVAQLLFFDWASEAGAGVALTDNDMNYVYVEYNSGTPQVIATITARTEHHTNVFLASIYREGTTLHITQDSKKVVVDHAGQMIDRLNDTMPFARVSGGVISEVGTRNLAITAGDWWEGLTEFTTAAIDTSASDTFRYFYGDGAGGFTEVGSQTAIDNTQYDGGAGSLATLTNNKYGVHWVYQAHDDDVYVIYGDVNGTLTEAEDASEPSHPPHFDEGHAKLLGRIIIQKSASTFASIQSAFNNTFSLHQPTDHAGLINLSADDHTQYALADGSRAFTGAITTSSTFDGRDVATDGTKLDAIEASADVTDVTNVTAAGALMDSELTDIAAVKTASDASIAVTDTGTSTTAFVTPAGLAGSALQTKVDGIEALADVTDATNVVAAIDAAVVTDAGTPAATDQVLIKDAGTGALQSADFSDFTYSDDDVDDWMLTDLAVFHPGHHDHTTAQAAIDAAEAAGGGVVQLKAGATYAETLTITVANVHIVGNGATINDTAGSGTIINFSADDCSIRDTFVTGPNSIRDSVNYGIRGTNADRLRILNCDVSGTEAAGIFIDGGLDVKIIGNHVHDNLADGIHLTNVVTRAQVLGNTTNNTDDDGIAVVGYTADLARCTDVTIADNVIFDSSTRGITVLGCDRAIIANNRIQTTDSAGILLGYDGSYATYGCDTVLVHGNSVEDTNNVTANAGIFVQGNATHPSTAVKIVDNQVRDVATGISCASTNTQIEVRGNDIHTATGVAINAETCAELRILNNTFTDVDHHQISVTPFTAGNVYVRNNIAVNMNSSATASRRFITFETATPDYIEVVGNHVNGSNMQAMIRSTAAVLSNIHENFEDGVATTSFAGEPPTKVDVDFWSNINFESGALITGLDASTTTAGVVELLTTAELDTGTDTTRVPTAAAIEGSARSLQLDRGGYTAVSATTSGTYTLVLGDAGKLIRLADLDDLTVPANSSVAFVIGTTIGVLLTTGSANVLDAAGVTINSESAGAASIPLIVDQIAVLTKLEADIWNLSGV